MRTRVLGMRGATNTKYTIFVALQVCLERYSVKIYLLTVYQKQKEKNLSQGKKGRKKEGKRQARGCPYQASDGRSAFSMCRICKS